MAILLMMNNRSNNNNSDNAPNSFSTMQEVSTTIVPADPIVKNTPQQVTQWVDDTALQSASLPAPIVPEDNLLAGGSEIREHNIKDILERPVKLADFEWKDTDVFESTLATYNFPEDLITASSNVADKITHFTFLRAHVVVRFVVNANTFQAGRLVPYFAPYNTVSEIGNRATINNYMAAKTMFPRVVLDAGSGNSGELTIPYASYFTHYNLVQGLGDLGQVIVTVLNPLQSGSATVSVFARFADVHLEIPTAAPNAFGAVASSSLFNGLLRKFGKRKLNKMLDMPIAQVGEAVDQARKGILSGALDMVSSISSMGSGLPIIGKYLVPLGWMSDAASQVAKYFGLSKPANLMQTQRYANIPGFGFTNMDGADNSNVLGGSVTNEIGSRHDLFGSGMDEMDVTFIAMHECYLDSFSWETGNLPGTDLFTMNVAPGSCKSAMRSSVNMFDSTALAYVASMFKFWRGSIQIKVQVTKTAYHSGRLRVSYVPGGVLPVGTSWDLNQGYSEIVDLRTSDEITLKIPFVSNTLWKPVDLIPYGQTGQLPTSTGVVVVEVLNTLRRPDSVTSTLQGNIWISAGEDIQFAVPDFQSYMPVIDDATSLAEGVYPYYEDMEFKNDLTWSPYESDTEDDLSELPRAQVLGQFQDVGFNAMNSGGELFTSGRVAPIDAEASSIGEHVQNLRPLIRRCGIVGTYNVPNGATSAVQCNTGYFGSIAKTSAPTTAVAFTPLDYVSYLYRFYRGGQRFKYICVTQRNGTMSSFTRNGVDSAPIAPGLITVASSFWQGVLNSGSAFLHVTSPLLNLIHEVLVPYYSNTYISLIRDPSATGGLTSNHDLRSYIYMVYSHTNTGTNNITMLRGAADDFSFGWLVGPPRLIPRPINGVSTTINFSGADTVAFGTIEGAPEGLRITTVSTTPAASVGATIISSAVATIPVTLSDASVVQVPVVGGTRISDANGETRWAFPYETAGLTADLPTTLAAIVALGSFNVSVQPPTFFA